MTQLGLDFDNDSAHAESNIKHMESAIRYLIRRFGREHVFKRKSSSGKGWHVWVDVELTQEEELALRKELHDCKGRRMSDKGRLAAGFQTSRLFKWKSEIDTVNDKSITRMSGGWKTC